MTGKDGPQEQSLQFVLLLLLLTLKRSAGFRWAHSVSSVCEASPFTSLHLLSESRRFSGGAVLKTLAEESRPALCFHRYARRRTGARAGERTFAAGAVEGRSGAACRAVRAPRVRR